jgi:hypothetical protein
MRSAILEQLNSDGKASPAEWSSLVAAKLSAADLLMPQESSIAGGIAGQKQRDNTPCRGCLFVDEYEIVLLE